MQDHQFPNAKLPSPTELFTDEAFEPGKEIAEFGNNNNPKVQGLQDGLSLSSSSQQNNKINSTELEDELDKYLGKKSSGISSYTRKNSVESGSGSHGSGTGSHSGNSECENNTKPQHQLINKEDMIINAPMSPQTQPSWKLTFCLKKVQKTNYSQVAANIREENNKNISTSTNQNKSDSPPLDPRKSHHSGNGSKDSATGCSTWMTAVDEDVELNLHLSDDEEMDDEFQEPISEDISSIQQPDRLSDEQRDFSEKGFTTSGL